MAEKCPRRNIVYNYQAKQHFIDVYLHDQSGSFDYLSSFSESKLYLKKYPLNGSNFADSSIAEWDRDVSQGKITFNITPIIADVSYGDYLMQVNIGQKGGTREYVVLQDTYHMLETLKPEIREFTLFDVDPSWAEFSILDASSSFYMNTNTGWVIDPPYWITSTPDNGISGGEFILDASAEQMLLDQVRIWTPYQPGLETQIDVSFYYPSFDIDPSSIAFDLDGSTMDVSINTQERNTWGILSKPTWIEDASGTGPENLQLRFISDTYVYDGSVVFDSSYNNYSQQLDLTFIQPEFNVDPSTINFDLDNSTFDVSINTHSINRWGQISKPTWIVPSVTSGTGSTNVTLRFVNDTFVNDGSLTYDASFNDFTIGLDLTFIEPSFYIDPEAHTFIEDASSTNVNLFTNVINPWNVKSKPSWINIDMNSGTGDSSIKISTDASTRLSTESIVFEADYNSNDITVDVSFWIEDLSVGPNYDFTEYDVSTITNIETWDRDDWSIQNIPEWLSFDVSEGSGNASILVESLYPNYSASVDVSIYSLKTGWFTNNYTYTYNNIPDFGDLKGYWTFDETLDSSQAGTMTTLRKDAGGPDSTFTPIYYTGALNEAVGRDYNGIQYQYQLTKDFSTNFDFANDWTISYWVRMNSGASGGHQQLVFNLANPAQALSLTSLPGSVEWYNVNRYIIEYDGATSIPWTFPQDVSINDWQCFAVVNDTSTQTIEMYLNGESMGAKDTSSIVSTSGGNDMTMWLSDGVDNNQFDELYVYDTVIDASGILDLYNRV